MNADCADGTRAGIDTLASPADRTKVARFLASIDASTATFPERTMNEARALCLP